jgi:hypothetical protein
MIKNERFGLVCVKTESINSGTCLQVIESISTIIVDCFVGIPFCLANHCGLGGGRCNKILYNNIQYTARFPQCLRTAFPILYGNNTAGNNQPTDLFQAAETH